MPRPGETTGDSILDAASRRYERFGPRKTTMSEVAREAGFSRATVYCHFPSKEALYTGLLERETRSFIEEIEAVAASTREASGKLAAILATTTRVYSERKVLCGALVGDDDMVLERAAAPVVRAYEDRVMHVLRGVLDEGVVEGSLREVDTQAVAYLMFQLGQGLVLREVTGRADFAFERILGAMNDLLASGIVAQRPAKENP